jgi:colanic acid biosynthesis glycosyl transferase WcaI
VKILLITFQFPPERTGNAPLLGELCEDLSARGHEITAIAAPVHHSFRFVPKEYRRGILSRENYPGALVVRCNGPLTADMWVNKLIAFVHFPVSAVLLGGLMKRRDVILCPSPPLWLGFAASLVSALKHTPYVYVVQDLWPSAPVRLGLWKNRLLIRFFSWMERYVYHKAARLIIVADSMRREVTSTGVADSKVHTIENWVDTSFIRPLPKDNAFRREVASPGQFILLYAGNMGHSHRIDVVLRAANILRHRRDLRFVLIGEGTQKPRLMEMAGEMGLENVVFRPLQPRSRLPEAMAAADVGLVPLRKGLSTASLPSKIYTIMASGRPLVATLDRNEAAWRLVERARCGLLVEPEQPEALAEAIEQLAGDTELCRQLGENGRRYAERHCDRRACTAAYEGVLLDAAQARQQGLSPSRQVAAGSELHHPLEGLTGE